MAQLEYGDYYKFVVSCGIGLIVVSVGLPWLFLHESFDLLIESSKLTGLTPLARVVIGERQASVAAILRLIPWASGFFGVGGIGLIVYGLLGWRERQRVRDEIENFLRDKSREELRAMDKGEIENKARAEVVRQESGDPSNAPNLDPASVDAAVADYLQLENMFLDVLEERIPEGYKLLRHQRSLSYEYDALLRSDKPNADEYIIEFTVPSANMSGHYLSDMLNKISMEADWGSFSLFEERTRKIPVLIAVAETINAKWIEDISQFLRLRADDKTAISRSLVRFITPARLTSLSAKDVAVLLDPSLRLHVFSD